MASLYNSYLKLLANKNYSILIATLFFGQIASGLLLISLINSVFTRTGSNFGVSGVVLSLAVPSFFLMVVAGLAADLVDRKRIIVLTNLGISLIVLLILFSLNQVFASIFLSFCYFAANTFFIPAVSAATGQLVKKNQLTIANSVFILTLSGGQIIGLFVGALLHYFFASITVLIFCEVFLVICVFLPLLLPPLLPRKDKVTLSGKIIDIFEGFIYVFSAKQVWFFFIAYASIQGWAAFGTTLAPGFFDEIWHINIDKSPILIMPFVGIGNLLGSFIVHHPKFSETRFIAIGMGAVGLTGFILGICLKFFALNSIFLILPLVIFLTAAGFGGIIQMIASRTALQRRIDHRFQGTVFGASVLLSAFLASVMSPTAAVFELAIGYINVLILGSVVFLATSFAVYYVGNKWRF